MNVAPSLVKSCMGKKRYRTQEAAFDALKQAVLARGTPLRVYVCSYCNGGYHLTKRPGFGVPDEDSEILKYKAHLAQMEAQKAEADLKKKALDEKVIQAHAVLQAAQSWPTRISVVQWMRAQLQYAYRLIRDGQNVDAAAFVYALINMPKKHLKHPDSQAAQTEFSRLFAEKWEALQARVRLADYNHSP